MVEQSKAPGSVEWLRLRIAEHEQAREQAKAQANAHNGAAQAYQRLVAELQSQQANKSETPDEDAA